MTPTDQALAPGQAPAKPDGAAQAVRALTDAEALAIASGADVAMVLTDPSLPDNPIVYVNDAFERITGFSRAFALGRNCRFMQGPLTDPDQVRTLREAIAEGREVAVDILNARADGTAFRNRLLVAPVRGRDGRITHFVGIQKALSPEESRRSLQASGEDALREVQHRVKNHLAMIVGLIRIQARKAAEGGREGAGAGGAGGGPYDTLARRVESLQLIYEELSGTGPARGGDRIGLGTYLMRVCEVVAQLDGRPGIRVAADMAPLQAPVEAAARVGLILSEVVTNALEHAFAGRAEGRLVVTLGPLADGGARLAVEDDGAGLPPGTRWPDMASMGGRIVAGLVESLGARLDLSTGPGGTRVTLDLPPDAIQP